MPVKTGAESVDRRERTRFDELLLKGVSAIALCALGVGALTGPVYAQEADDDGDEDTIVVTGVRASLRSAQEIKRNADTVVDSITATDIGAFPDKSVAEALQRVAGITVNRFAASDDTAHFSAEPSGVIVRGLNQVRNEFNGRDSFSANSSRGLGWGDVSPELMAGVDTYKNQTAELIEGGIAGTVNLRTRLPFDNPGRQIAITGAVNYGDISKQATPDFSAIYTDRWAGQAGEFGVMANIAYSEVQTASEGIQLGRMGNYDGVYSAGRNYIPSSVAYRDNLYDRTRNGMSLAAQWQDSEEKFLATVQYNRSDYENVWHEYVVGSYFADLFYSRDKDYAITPTERLNEAPQPLGGTPAFTFDSQGYFQTGTMTNDIGWWGSGVAESALFAQNSLGQNFVNPCYNNADNNWGATPLTCVSRRGPEFGTATRFNHNQNTTDDVSFNLKWNPTDRLRLNFDIQKINSTVENYDMEVDQQSFANVRLDLSGEHPVMELSTPLNINIDPGGTATPGNYYYRAFMDHIEDSEGEELAVRGDAEFLFQTTWLDSLKVGVRHADREQQVRWSGYNWQNIANNWTQNAAYYNITRHDASGTFNGYPRGHYTVRPFGDDDFFGGGVISPNQFVFFDMNLIEDHAKLSELFGAEALGLPGSPGWNPICSERGNRADETNCFLPVEVADVQEVTDAAYFMLKFGGPDASIGGIGVSGNFGARYVTTTNTSSGSLAFPTFGAGDLLCEVRDTQGQPTPPNFIPNTVGCYLSDDDIAFAQGGGDLSTVEVEHENWLPSFNLRLDLTEDWILRFAASRALSRPDIGYLKNFTRVAFQLPSVNSPEDDRWIRNAQGVVTGVEPTYSADAFNPFLGPVTADQGDITLEWYFSDVGSLTFAAFYKQFNDYIQYGEYTRDVEANGVTREVNVRAPVAGEGAKVKGFEIAYQQFFDFLPGWLSGFGVQANYTYIENDGITNANVRIVSSDGTSQTTNAGNPTLVNVDQLEGLSEQSYNLVGMYEKGPWALRLAYNWRSEYLVTAFDCCVYRPVVQEDAGFLDGSIRFRVNDRMELSLQGSNLLDTETVLRQQVQDAEDGGLTLPNAWFRNDRRFVGGVRFKF